MTNATLPPPTLAPSIVTTPPPIIPGAQYPMTRNSDGTWNAYGVRLMGVMRKGDKGLPVELGAEWHKKAVATAQFRFHNGAFLHPLHLNHTSDKRGKVAVGFFLPTHVEEMTYDGKPMSTMLGDYIAVQDWAAREMQAGRWPYGSIENLDYEAAEINEFALMADSEPWFHFPMQTYRVVEGAEASALNIYDKRQFQCAAASRKGFALVRIEGAKATFCAYESDEKKKDENKQGPAADPAANADPSAKTDAAAAKADPNADPTKADPNADPAAQGDVPMQCLSLLKQLVARLCAPDAAKAKNPTPAEQPPPADPGKGSAYSKETPVSDPKTPAPETKPDALELAKKTADADALAEKNSALEAEKAGEKAIEAMVADGEKRLAGRILNKERIKKSLTEMAKAGKPSFDAYVTALEGSLAPAMPSKADAVTKHVDASADTKPPADAPKTPASLDLQAKYGHLGPKGLEAARKASADFDAQARHLTCSREEYVDFALSMTPKEA